MLFFPLILLRFLHWLMIWSEYCLGGNPHLKSWFVELSWTQNLKYHQSLCVSHIRWATHYQATLFMLQWL